MAAILSRPQCVNMGIPILLRQHLYIETASGHQWVGKLMFFNWNDTLHVEFFWKKHINHVNARVCYLYHFLATKQVVVISPQERDARHYLGCWSLGDPRSHLSISDKTSCCKILQSLKAARCVFRIVRLLWNLTGTLAAQLLTCLSNFKAMQQFKLPISRLQDFTRSHENTSYGISKRGPEQQQQWYYHSLHAIIHGQQNEG